MIIFLSLLGKNLAEKRAFGNILRISERKYTHVRNMGDSKRAIGCLSVERLAEGQVCGVAKNVKSLHLFILKIFRSFRLCRNFSFYAKNKEAARVTARFFAVG